ncbi:MAG TPA: TonB-dependent receptor [Myxococcales bacterium]|nr:TonB-dependent receptor [Myxococcales bacterium]
MGDRPDPNLFGSSAETITRDELEALPGGDTQPVTNLVAMQPGVHQDSFGSNLHVRGNDGAVLYVLDGIPMVSPAVGTVGQLLNTIPTRLIQNLQIYTGGFPVEYSYSLGGVVDIRTRRATDTPMADTQLTYGTYDEVDAAADYSQRFGKLGVVASANFTTTDRGLDTPDAIDVLNDNRLGGNGFAKLSYRLDSRNTLEAFGTYEEDRFEIPIDPTMLPLSDAPPGAVRGNDAYGDPPPQFVPYDANPTDFERTLFAAASYLHTGDDVSSQLSLYAREIYEDFDCDPAHALGATADPGSFCSDFIRDAYHFGLLGKITWSWLRGNSWKAGIQVDESHSTLSLWDYTRDDASPTGGIDPSLTISGGDDIDTLTAGAYIEDRIEFGKFTLLPGARFDIQNTSFGPSSNLGNLFLSGPSGRLGASWAPVDWVVAHAFVGYLWEAPTDFDAPVIAPLVNPGGPAPYLDMKPATTVSSELGITFHPVHKLALGIDGWNRIMRDWLDHQNIGNTPLWAAFNWAKGTAWGGDLFGNGEIVRFWDDRFILDGFGNLSTEWADQLGIDSNQFLFDPGTLAGSSIDSIQDHIQFWTANVGLMLHDVERWNSLSVRVNYGSGFHTGINNTLAVPEHTTVDVSASHTFDMPTKPQIVFDAFNLFNDIYAYRLATGFFGNSQYAPLQRFDVRLILHFG